LTGLTQIEKVMHLRRVDLFSHCSAEQIIRIAAIAGERMFEPGEEIYQSSDPSEALFCVVAGNVVLEGYPRTSKRIDRGDVRRARNFQRSAA
jgi:signal-transduction protein with cAMP-binding, CBS, and nucleotidyltransferase domain